MNGARPAIVVLCALFLAACTNHLVDQWPVDPKVREDAARLPLPLLARGAAAAEIAYHGEGAVRDAFRATHSVTYLPVDEQNNPKTYDALFLAVPTKPCVPLTDPAVRNGDLSGVQILAFRGTADVNDMFVNLTPGDVLVEGTPLRLHPGFLLAARNALTDLGDGIVARTKAGCPLLLLGHSKGGATAVATFLLLAEVHHVPPERMLAVTVGQPTVSFPVDGRLSERIIRIIHAQDAVPTVPPATRNRYRHVGTAIFLWDDPDRWSLLPREKAEGEWWDAEKTLTLMNKAIANGFRDHSSSAYRDRLAALKLEDLTPYNRNRRWPK
jgi:hypothetical protein